MLVLLGHSLVIRMQPPMPTVAQIHCSLLKLHTWKAHMLAMWKHQMWWVQMQRTTHCRPELLPCYFISPYSLPSGSEGGSCLKCRRPGFDPWVGKIPWRGKWQPTPVFFPGKSYGQRSLVSYSTRGCRVRHNWATNTFTFFYSFHLTCEISSINFVLFFIKK